MSTYSSELLAALLDGKLSEEQESEIARALEVDLELRHRLEMLSGSGHWAIGSAPEQPEPKSASLQAAIEKVVSEARSEQLASLSRSSDATSSDRTNSNLLPTDEVASDGDCSHVSPLEIPGIRIVREIGRGGMGIVYEGWDELVGRKVAVKQLHPVRSQHPDARFQLLREARSAGALSHPNIVPIYSVHLQNDIPILVHQYVEGETLQDRIDQKRFFSWQEVIDLTRQIALGLQAAHVSGIVHRDLKPDNILIEQETNAVRIADFGVATQRSQTETDSKTVAGTPAYMSPEQTKGGELDPRSDLFSLGSVMVTALTGKPPFGQDDPFVVMDRIRNQEPQYKNSLDPNVPPWLINVIDRLLEKDPNKRMPSPTHLLKAMEASKPRAANKLRLSLATLALLGVVIGTICAFEWLGLLKGVIQSNTPSNSLSIIEPENAFIPVKRVWIRRNEAQFDSLAEAIDAADNGDIIEIGSDLQCASYRLNKKLTIKGAQGRRPVITNENDAGIGEVFFLRSENDLTLDGLEINWAAPESPIVDAKRINAVIGSAPGAELTIQNCRIRRESAGVVVATAGNLEIKNSVIEGGSFALAWFASHSHASIEESVLGSRSGIAVMYPPQNTTIFKQSILSLKHSLLRGEEVVTFMMTRRHDVPVQIRTENCLFDTDYIASLMSFNNNIREQCESNAPSIFQSIVEWHESRCVHDVRSQFLISRRFRNVDLPIKTPISNFEQWQILSANASVLDDDKSVVLKLSPASMSNDAVPICSYRIEGTHNESLPEWLSKTGQTNADHTIIAVAKSSVSDE